eukprot:jgi/Psemu1/260748/estExt_Genewise1Plus.C_4900035
MDQSASVPDFDDDWEEWDGTSPFWVHCVAGSMAGVAEHVLVYPLDTVRTHIQRTVVTSSSGGGGVAAAAALESAAATATTTTTTTIAAAPDMTRLWRGVQTILVGCIPAHALYFSMYEIVKAATLDQDGNVTTYGSALAGGAAVFGHDLVLGPLDTVKQRLQLGHYQGLTDALQQMIRNEGAVSLLRSFPVTLATNIPYGMIMVGTNEFLKEHNSGGIDHSELTLGVTLGASSLAGLVAAATTTPLDRIKTYLQTQQMAPSCLLQQNTTAAAAAAHCPLKGTTATSATASTAATTTYKPVVADWRQAALRIYQQEGYAGFFRGVTPRILSHTPAVAISWTTYETFKRYLQEQFCDE